MSIPGLDRRDAGADDRVHRLRGLSLLTLVLAIAAPLVMYFGRIPGLDEFDYLIFYRLLFYNDLIGSLAMLLALAAMLLVRPLRDRVARLAGWMSLHPGRASLVAFVLFAVMARIVYQGFPLAMDEYVQLLQAKVFAAGQLVASYPPELLDRMVPPGFQGYFILVNHETGQAASVYWPGLPLLMAPFAKLGGEWLLNPALAAIGLWLIGDLASKASGQPGARGWAMLAALACPQYTVNALSFYAMPGVLTLNLLFFWLLLRPGWRPAMLAGVVGSIALVMHNPLPHALFAMPVGIWLLMDGRRRSRLLPLALGYLPLVLMLCLGWPMLMDAMGLRVSVPAADGTGFVELWSQKLRQTFAIPDANLLRVQAYSLWKALIWVAPGLLLVALLAKQRSDIQRVLLAGLLLSFAFYFFFPHDQGHGWGYRYIHHAWAVVAITAGVFAVADNGVRTQFASAALGAGLLATPVFLFLTQQTIALSIAQQPTVPVQGRSLVFISNRPQLYTADLVRNYPSDNGHTVRMLGSDPEGDAAFARQISADAVRVNFNERGSVWMVPHRARSFE